MEDTKRTFFKSKEMPIQDFRKIVSRVVNNATYELLKENDAIELEVRFIIMEVERNAKTEGENGKW